MRISNVIVKGVRVKYPLVISVYANVNKNKFSLENNSNNTNNITKLTLMILFYILPI